MIQCIIDGKVGYPDTKNKIKVTYENQYINDSGSYTYQINFPMAIVENKRLFGNVNRFDVKKTMKDFEECRLLVDNRLIISGKGTVMSITNDSVKLQIVGGKSRIKYNSKFTSHFIDEIDYPDTGVITKTSDFNGQYGSWWSNWFHFTLNGVIETDLSKTHVVGQEGKFAFNPIYDETNDIIANAPFVCEGIVTNQQKVKLSYMYDVAVQPYLMYVLKCVLEYEGFTLVRNDFDKEPWNRLVICSARKGTDIKLALPHWSVYTFIDELRKLFNASFVFDEVAKTVSVIATNELLANTAKEYECTDEFSSEYDEDGLKNLATSNIEYEFAESQNRDYLDVIPQSALKKFPVKEFTHQGAVIDAAEAMSQKDRMTTIFHIPDNYIVFVLDEDDKETMEHAGFFNPLIREEDSEESQKLNICPVAMVKMYRFREDDNKWFILRDIQRGNMEIAIPSVTNEKEADLEDMNFDEDEGEYYISVQDAMEDSSALDEQDEKTDEIMQVAFQSKAVYDYQGQQVQWPERDGEGSNPRFRYPVLFTDYRKFPWLVPTSETATLSLNALPHKQTLHDYASDTQIDKHNLICIKFPSDDIPDPSNIFMFRNKKFICQKIEIEVNEYGIDRMKTGYFYELFS